MDISKLTIKDAQEGLRNGSLTSVSLTEACLKNIKKKNNELNVYLEVFETDAKNAAKEADKLLASGQAGPLTGIPFAIKDNMVVDGVLTTAGSKILDGFISNYTASALSNLLDQKAVLLGRTNMDEFAMGSSTENSAFGASKNPIDTNRVPGGSSGGSAAAVAMGGALFALGSDTGGSIRQPGSFCGVVGFKPSYGTVSRFGLLAMSSSLDQIGPLAKTVDDAKIVFEQINHYDKKDGTCVPKEQRSYKDTGSKKIGVIKEMLEMEGLDQEVRENFEDNLNKLEKKGWEVEHISIPSIKYSLPAYYVIMPAEASSNLARYDGVKYGFSTKSDVENTEDFFSKTRGQGFGSEVKRRIMLGTFVLSSGYYDAYYGQAIKVKQAVTKDLQKALEKVDFIVSPSTPTKAFKLNEKAKDPLSMYLSDFFTVSANLAQLPAISVPSGFSVDGLPFGFHIIGSKFNEDSVFLLGKNIEDNE